MVDQNTLYARYDLGLGASTSYYGYLAPNQFTNLNPSDSSANFAIKEITYSGNVQYVIWANNSLDTYECSWTNRAAYFATPSNTSISGTATNLGALKQANLITFNWIAATGASRYSANITFMNPAGNTKQITYLPDACSDTRTNPYLNSTNLVFVGVTSCTLYNCLSGGYTYSISLYPYNGIANGVAATASVFI